LIGLFLFNSGFFFWPKKEKLLVPNHKMEQSPPPLLNVMNNISLITRESFWAMPLLVAELKNYNYQPRNTLANTVFQNNTTPYTNRDYLSRSKFFLRKKIYLWALASFFSYRKAGAFLLIIF
jgi:uncharacterized protein YozE (UPF0346 family)